MDGAAVHSGEASVEAARQLQPDLVLMDIHLPGITGPEATRRILNDVAWPKPPPIIFLLSTYEAADYATETVACGGPQVRPPSVDVLISIRSPAALLSHSR